MSNPGKTSKQDDVDGLNRLLETAGTYNAQIWSYEVSHQVLVLRIEIAHQEAPISLHIGACERITGPTAWRGRALRIHFTVDATAAHWIFDVVDEEAGFSARGHLFHWERTSG